MFEFKVNHEIKTNAEVQEINKEYSHKIKKGKIKHLLNNNLQIIASTEYISTYLITLIILK